MAPLASTSRLLNERRLFPVIGIVPYVVLAGLVVFTVIVRYSRPNILVADLGLCLVTGAWMLVLFSITKAWRGRPRIMAVFFVGIVILLGAMVAREPWFGLFAVAGYIYAFGLLRWPWRIAGVAAIAVIAGAAQGSSIPRNTSLGLTAFTAIIFVNVFVMCGYCWIQWTSDELGLERTRALDAVRLTNARLEASLAENTVLHEQLVARARAAGVNDERQRMAGEIHDTLAQGLIGIITQLQAADAGDADPDVWRSHFESATALARESLSAARRSVAALRPEQLENGQLGDALASVAERWSERNRIPVQFVTTGTPRPVAPEAEVALLRAVQETLANVGRHAYASRVGVTLSYLAEEVALDVRDDGDGFDPGGLLVPTPDGGGFGLTALRQRIELLHGSVGVESEIGWGAAVSIRIPVRERSAHE
jgi:signal transduction histidine kinase